MTEDKRFKCLVCGEEYSKSDRHHCLDYKLPLDDNLARARSVALETRHKRRQSEGKR